MLYASTGVGTAPHLSGELLAQRAGIKLVHVPYQGSPQAATDLLAGRVSIMFSPISAVIAQVEAGKLKAIASATSTRPAIAPNVPTMAEAGMPDFDTSIWFGLVAPAGTPRAIVDKLANAVKEAQKSDDVLKISQDARVRCDQRRTGRVLQEHAGRGEALDRGGAFGWIEKVALCVLPAEFSPPVPSASPAQAGDALFQKTP